MKKKKKPEFKSIERNHKMKTRNKPQKCKVVDVLRGEDDDDILSVYLRRS